MTQERPLDKFLFPLRKASSYFRMLQNLYLIRSTSLFDKDLYLKNNPDIAKSKVDPVLHYLRYGGFEGRDPGPNFCSSWYINTYEDVRESGINPLIHYLKYGQKEGRGVSAQLPETKAGIVLSDLSLIRSSGIFNEIWYLVNNPDVADAKMDPVVHYLFYGGYEGRDPSPGFHSNRYLDAYEDVKKAGLNPLLHYLKYGQAEGRDKGCEEGHEAKTFILRRMYDYSKQANSLVFEASSERVYLQRPRVIGSFSGDLDAGEALCPPAYVSVIENAVVFGGSSLVVVQPECILSDELVDFAGEAIGIKSPLVKFRQENTLLLEYKKELDLPIKEGILLSCDHDNNYFHWLIECLPKLLLIDELDQFKEMPLLIPKGLHRNLEEALRRVNINDHQIIHLEPNIAYRVERLIYPSALSRIVDRYQGRAAFDTDIILSRQWISRVSNLLKGNENDGKKTWRKLFLTRRKGLRSLGNREELELMLLKQGFEIVDLDDASLGFQIELFSQAAMVVAPTGAALTNLLFCRPRTEVIIFMSNHEVTNFYFWSNLGAINNLKVTTIAGERLFNLTNYWSVHDDYVVNPDLVLKEIKKAERRFRINKVQDKVTASSDPILLKIQEIWVDMGDRLFQTAQTCSKSDLWSSSRLGIKYVKMIRALLIMTIRRKGLDPKKDEFFLKLALVLSSPHIVDYFYNRSSVKETSSTWQVPEEYCLVSRFVLQCLTQPSFKIDYREIRTLLNYQSLWPLIISKSIEYRLFSSNLSDLEIQFDFLKKNLELFMECLKSGGYTDLPRFLRWYIAAPPIGFSPTNKETYELYRALEQSTLQYLDESPPPFEIAEDDHETKRKARIGFLFLSLLSGVENKLVLEILHYVPEDYQIVMIGLNDKEYPPEIKVHLAERNIETALIEQMNVRDSVSDLRKLNLDVAFYCSPFWGHFLSRIALICAARVAPLQIAYIGDVITTGLSSCDYFALPSALYNDQIKQGFTEKIMIVPNALMSQFALKPNTTGTAFEKDSTTVVYFSNAHMWKLNGDLIDVWAQILSKVDNAIIRLAPLKSTYHKSYLPVLQDLIAKKCKKWGVRVSRFEIIHDAGADQIQKQLARSDVYLDSFPYTASTSLLEALAQSLPIVSLTGPSYPESLSKVMLIEFGLEEDALFLSKDAYVAKATALGQDTTLRKETSRKIEMKIAESTKRLNKREILLRFWNEVDKLIPELR